MVAAKFLSSLSFAIPIQTFFLFAKGLSFLQIMLLESILLLADLLFELPTGVLGDRVGRKWSLVFGSIVMLLSWIPWFIGDTFPYFACSFFLGGIAYAFQSGSDEALIYDDLKQQGKEKKMQKFIGIYDASIMAGFAIASLIGGFLAASHNMDAFYLLYKLTVVMQGLGLLVCLTIHEPPITKEGRAKAHLQETAVQHFVNGAKYLFQHKKLRKIFLLNLFTVPFSYVLIYLFQPYLQQANVPAALFGVAVFCASVASIAAKMSSYKMQEWFGVEKGTLIATIAPGVAWLLMALIFDPVLSFAMYILCDAIGNLRDPIFSDYTNRHIESHNRATVISTIYVIESFYAMIARPFMGWLADFDIRYAFVAIGLIIVSAAIFLRIGKEDVEVG
jgi:MFS family permease